LIDPNEGVKVDPRVRGALRAVESEEDVRDVSGLGHRYDSAGDARVWRGGPFGERFADHVSVKTPFRVGEEDPSILVERFLELGDVVVIEAVDVELDDADDLVVVGGHGSHCGAPSVMVMLYRRTMQFVLSSRACPRTRPLGCGTQVAS